MRQITHDLMSNDSQYHHQKRYSQEASNLSWQSDYSIIRILFMIPIYSLISAAAYAVYWYAMYLVVIRVCYEW